MSLGNLYCRCGLQAWVVGGFGPGAGATGLVKVFGVIGHVGRPEDALKEGEDPGTAWVSSDGRSSALAFIHLLLSFAIFL